MRASLGVYPAGCHTARDYLPIAIASKEILFLRFRGIASGATITADLRTYGRTSGTEPGDCDARPLAEFAHGRRRIIDDQQFQMGATRPKHGPDLVTKSAHAFLVQVVIHAPDEADGVNFSPVGEKYSLSTPLGKPVGCRTGGVVLRSATRRAWSLCKGRSAARDVFPPSSSSRPQTDSPRR